MTRLFPSSSDADINRSRPTATRTRDKMGWPDAYHSIANVYLIPLAMMLKASGVALPLAGDAINLWELGANLIPVIAGNLVGGSVLVALVYHVIYQRPGQAH